MFIIAYTEVCLHQLYQIRKHSFRLASYSKFR